MTLEALYALQASFKLLLLFALQGVSQPVNYFHPFT